jgi:aryl-alcohol dehydrogenase-like predicted oxidoreductase
VDKERAFACVDAMRPVAEKHGASIARIALAWLLSWPAVSTVIIGAKTVAQLQDNIAAEDIVLDEEDLAALDQVSGLPAEYPGWMIEFQAKYRAAAPTRP